MPEVGEGDDRPWRRREAPLDIREMHTPPPILISPAKEKGLVFLFRSRGGGLVHLLEDWLVVVASPPLLSAEVMHSSVLSRGGTHVFVDSRTD